MPQLIPFSFFNGVTLTSKKKTRHIKKILKKFFLGIILIITINTFSNNQFFYLEELNLSNESEIEQICTFSEVRNPLDQFEIRDLVSLNILFLHNLHISLTNMGAYLLLSIFLIINLSLLSTNENRMISNKSSMWQESLYDTVHSIVKNQINAKKGQIFFPFIYSLFIFVLTNNLISMVPYSFASTSHFILTFSISFTIVLGSSLLGFNKHGLKFFSLFVPAGCPAGLLPILVLIEFISYLTRNISLGLRLAANIFSGHMLLNILSGFTFNIMKSGFFFFILGLFPLTFIIAFSGLEVGIAFIQSQVFVVLSCSYIKDALELH